MRLFTVKPSFFSSDNIMSPKSKLRSFLYSNAKTLKNTSKRVLPKVEYELEKIGAKAYDKTTAAIPALWSRAKQAENIAYSGLQKVTPIAKKSVRTTAKYARKGLSYAAKKTASMKWARGQGRSRSIGRSQH